MPVPFRFHVSATHFRQWQPRAGARACKLSHRSPIHFPKEPFHLFPTPCNKTPNPNYKKQACDPHRIGPACKAPGGTPRSALAAELPLQLQGDRRCPASVECGRRVCRCFQFFCLAQNGSGAGKVTRLSTCLVLSCFAVPAKAGLIARRVLDCGVLPGFVSITESESIDHPSHETQVEQKLHSHCRIVETGTNHAGDACAWHAGCKPFGLPQDAQHCRDPAGSLRLLSLLLLDGSFA